MDNNYKSKKTNKRTKNKKTIKGTQKNKQDKIIDPFSPIEILQAKEALKRLIDCMPTDEFIALSFFLSDFIYEDEMFDDDDLEYETDLFYNNKKNNIIKFPKKNNDL